MRSVYFVSLILALAGCTSLPQSYYVDYQSALNSGICNVHHVEMNKEKVPIIYGLIIEEPGVGPNYKTRMKRFPFADRFSLGGCVVMENSPEEELIYVCPACLVAQQRWIEDHPKDSWAKKMLSEKRPAEQDAAANP